MCLYVMFGLPGSGKTTYANRFDGIVHHFDDMPGANRKGTNDAAYVEFWRRIRTDLLGGKDVVADGIHTSKALRRKILDAVSDIGCRKVLIVMDTPLEECLRRNAKRTPPLSDFCIMAINAHKDPPSYDEGWDEIREVKSYEADT